jgi:hypothetical protein
MRIFLMIFSALLLLQCQISPTDVLSEHSVSQQLPLDEHHDEEHHHHDPIDDEQLAINQALELQSLSKGITIAGPWVPPPEVTRVADTQMVSYQGSPTIADGGSCDSDNPWACSCHHPACSAGLPGTLAFARYIQQAFPQISSAGGFQCCRQNTGNTSKLSVHSIGRAIDLMIPRINGDADNTAGDAVANWLIMNAASIGIQYVAWDRTQWSGHRPAGSKISPYQGPIPHTDHIHMELNLDGANQRTPFFTSGAINQGGRQCEARCDGTRIIDANCNEGDCAIFGNNCIADPVPRCGVAECPRTGTGQICSDDTHIVSCRDGLLTGVGDCGAFAAFCSTAGRDQHDAVCVSAFCVSNPNQAPYELLRCSFLVGEMFFCHENNTIDLLSCPNGQICSMQSGQAECTAPKAECPPVYARDRVDILNVCMDNYYVARCENGNVASAERCEGNSVCRMINQYPTCVTEQCVSGNEIRTGARSCLDNGMVGECNQDGAIDVIKNCNDNPNTICVQNGDSADCESVIPPPTQDMQLLDPRDMMNSNMQINQDMDHVITPRDAQVNALSDMRINPIFDQQTEDYISNDVGFSNPKPQNPTPSEFNSEKVSYKTSSCQQNQQLATHLFYLLLGFSLLFKKRKSMV